MTGAEQTYAWDGARLVAGPGAASLLAADSWLVADGAVRGLSAHRARFVAGCASEAGLGAGETDAFLDAALALLPTVGRWFPRIECGPDGGLHLRVRPAPEPAGPVVLAVHDEPDPRRRPRVKGPDLEMLGDLRRRAGAIGADEALLLAPDGTVVEGALSSVVWWDGDTLCVPDPMLPWLDGVTCRLVIGLAATGGHRVRHVRAGLAELDGRETWSLGALHGIRPVRGWAGTDLRAGPVERAADFQQRLHALAAPLPGQPAAAARARSDDTTSASTPASTPSTTK